MAKDFNLGRESPASDSSIRSCLIKSGLKSYSADQKPFLTRTMKSKRFDWCKKYLDMDIKFWRKKIFSDETYIEINHYLLETGLQDSALKTALKTDFLIKL